MKQEFTPQEMADFDKAMESRNKWEMAVRDHNISVLDANNIPHEDFMSITEDVSVTGKIEVVSKPSGTDNCEDGYGVFGIVYVDQRSVGDSGDSYEGEIYGHLGVNKWLKIPYEC